MNTINLTGNLTRDPELKNTGTGKAVCDFTIAVNRNYTNEDGTKAVDYVDCRIWNKGAENLCKYQNKGNKIGIIGNLRVEAYKDKDGNNRKKTYVLVNELEFLTINSNSKTPVKEETKPKNNDSVYEEFGNQIELSDEDLGW